MEKSKKNNITFVPIFQFSFFKPQYWSSWLLITVLVLMAMLPVKLRDPLLGHIGKFIGTFSKKARHRAWINLYYCLPELNALQREKIINSMFSTALQTIVMMVELGIYGPIRIRHRVAWYGREIIHALQNKLQNVIFLVPHSWGVDIPAMLLASEGQMMAAMFHHQSNELINYLWNTVRLRFGGRIHARNDGIKPFIQSIRQGYYGYYLPDQDHGAKKSEFVDFFSTYKATLPIIGRLMKICDARIVPLFPVYNSNMHRLEIYVKPPMENLINASNEQCARFMNKEVETFVRCHPEQYTWILKLLKTRKAGEIEPYKRNDLYPNSKRNKNLRY